MGREEVVWLRDWIEARPQWCRKRLARELCTVWAWRDERQRLKDFAARSFLLKLEAQGQITLPALRLAVLSAMSLARLMTARASTAFQGPRW